ncbi:Gfo/Idh/MocA family protein [Nonomuraea sp. NPDC050540]|uniref:Gfo/Idh/MocA family protein n=1 Tax=Nonomuraea sp. NPDC050540 TaxID=3364367 RepID=UPI0037A87462
MRVLDVLLVGEYGLGHQNHQRDMYAPAFEAHPGFRVTGRTEADDPLDRPDADVVSVCVPYERRVEVVTRALRAGKHVLVDKPMALTAAECARIAEAAAGTGLVCLPAHHQRFQPAVRVAREAIAAGKVGLPWNVQADFLVAGGGSVWPLGELLNFAPYATDAIHAMTALPVTAVYATGGPRFQNAPAQDGRFQDGPSQDGPEDLVTLCLTHERGMTSTVVAGRTPAMPGASGLSLHRYRVAGSHGTLLADANRPAARVLTTTGTPRGTWAGPSTVDRMLTELHTAVVTGRPAELGPADAVAALRVVEAARRSMASGQVEEVLP